MAGGTPNTLRSTTRFDVEALRSGIEASDAATISSLYASNARLTLVDRREQPSHPFQIAGKAAIGDFVDEMCGQNMNHRVDQVVVSDDGSRAAYLERCRNPDGTKMITTSMLDLRDGRIAAQISLQCWDKPESGDPTTAQAQAAAEHVGHLNFTRPDELLDFPHGRAEILNLGGGAVGRLTLDPGWRWSRDFKPIVGTEWCHVTHFLYHLSGTVRFHMADGTEFNAKPGDVTLVPAGHDAWVVGSEPAVVVDWQGAAHMSRKHHEAKQAQTI
jgi:mannose-6-phosphate isomerase-like protein (cupin superfamily)